MRRPCLATPPGAQNLGPHGAGPGLGNDPNHWGGLKKGTKRGAAHRNGFWRPAPCASRRGTREGRGLKIGTYCPGVREMNVRPSSSIRGGSCGELNAMNLSGMIQFQSPF